MHLDLRFYINERFRYSFSLSPTDAHGVSRTTFQALEEQLDANRQLFLMDYNTALTDCDTRVGVAVPTVDELSERNAAREKWWAEESAAEDTTANWRVRCPEQKFEIKWGSSNTFDMVCEGEAEVDA